MIKNNRKYLKRINTHIKKILPEAQSFLFGSILENKLVAGSDIDILIIAEVPKSQMERAGIIVRIEKGAKLPYVHPFDFHLLTQQEFDDWNSIYKLKIKKMEEYLNAN
jgi:hypothetical protein